MKIDSLDHAGKATEGQPYRRDRDIVYNLAARGLGGA